MNTTVLSVESQAKSLAAMLIYPTLGRAVDSARDFWPVAVVGALIT